MPHLAHVEIFYAYQSARLPKFEPSLRGLIVAGMGDGNVSNDVFCGLKILANNGVIVALSSRTGSGGISGAESGDFCVTCDNLNPQKARILLSTALNFTQNRAQIQEIFNSY